MKQIIKYKCDHCGDLFDSADYCLEHEDRHKRIEKANEMLQNGHTLKQIQDECEIWDDLPNYLEAVNQDNCFTVSHWQCCNKPAYRIIYIDMDGSVYLFGCGSWTGYYGNLVGLNYRYLKTPHPKEDLFIDKRYGSRC